LSGIKKHNKRNWGKGKKSKSLKERSGGRRLPDKSCSTKVINLSTTLGGGAKEVKHLVSVGKKEKGTLSLFLLLSAIQKKRADHGVAVGTITNGCRGCNNRFARLLREEGKKKDVVEVSIGLEGDHTLRC